MIRYKYPKTGIFLIDANEYEPNGWIMKEQERTIIGETADTYIIRFLESNYARWDEYGKYDAPATTAVGIHESRFVKWKKQYVQLKIF